MERKRGLRTFVRLDQGALLRHVALLGATIAVFLLREDQLVSRAIPWFLVGAAAANFGASVGLTAGDERVRNLFRRFTPLLGVATWTALLAATGGAAESPFVAGLWFEVGLSALTLSRRGIAVITLLSFAGLWIQEFARVSSPELAPLQIQSGFLLVMGGIAWVIHGRWSKERSDLSGRLHEEERKLSRLLEELEDARGLARIGEQAGRLSHALKNAVHSMRGLTRLLRERLRGQNDDEILAGLEEAIERLDLFAREELSLGRRDRASEGEAHGEDLKVPLEEAVQDLGRAFPETRCRLVFQPPPNGLRLSREVLREVTSNLLINAAESMDGRGRVVVASQVVDGAWRIQVSDSGSGLPKENRAAIFRAGYTTKEKGSGFGLFVSQKMVEAQGGRIEVMARRHRGTAFQLVFPLTAGA